MAPPLNLRQSLVDQFWETRDPQVRKLLFAMSTAEHWRLDSKEPVVVALTALTNKMEKARPDILVHNMDRLIHLMAYLSTPSAMLILEWLSERHDSLALLLLEKAVQRDDRSGRLLIERVQTIKAMTLLGAIFSPANVKHVTQLLKRVNGPNA
jgi:hypothetical protein